MTAGQNTPRLPPVWLIADAGTTPDTRVLAVLGALRPLLGQHRGRVGLIERDHTGTPDAVRMARIGRFRDMCVSAGVPFWVNGRVDLALASGADGVQLTGFGLAPAVVAHHFPTLPFAVSCHAAADLEAARTAGARFALLSPFAPPTSKPATRPSLDPLAFATLCRYAGLPVVALGGIRQSTATAAFDAGASGVATLGAVFRARDPEALLTELLAAAAASMATGSSGAS